MLVLVAIDLERLNVLVPLVSLRGRLLVVLSALLFIAAGDPGVANGWHGLGTIAVGGIRGSSRVSCNILKEIADSVIDGLTGDRPVSGGCSVCLVDGELVRVNMSLILRRRSNSGINLPERGGRSFIEHSRNLLPFLNTPLGFMISLISTSSPFKSTLSFKTANTGQ